MLKKIRSLISNSDFIEIYDNVLSVNECDALIHLFNRSQKIPGVVVVGSEWQTKPEVKKGVEVDDPRFSKGDPISQIIKPSLFNVLAKYLNKYPEFDKDLGKWEYDDGFTFKKFEGEDDGFKQWHCEQIPGCTSRILVWMFYLNDAESGTEFRRFPTVRAKMGRVILWPASWTHIHRSQLPNKGVKYIVSGWVSYKYNTTKIPSQDSNSKEEIEWDLEEMKKSIIESAEQSWDKYAGG